MQTIQSPPSLTIPQASMVMPAVKGRAWLMSAIFLLLLVCFALDLAWGSVPIPLEEVIKILGGSPAAHAAWTTIVLDFRLPKAITALLAGFALAASGLQMQTFFRNPLADPFILGISSGASLGVALMLLNTGVVGSFLLSGLGMLGSIGVAFAACLGAGFVMGVMLLVSRRGRSVLLLLILGIMFSYMTGALVSLLFYFSSPERIHAYLVWSFGSFGSATWQEIRIMAPLVGLGLLSTFVLSKPLNALLLGEMYARSMGVQVERTRIFIIISTSLLAGAVTAFCGPIAFLGLAVPHLARGLFKTADHHVLVPASGLLGACLGLIADMASQLAGANIILPLNAVTSLIGAPTVIWVILRQYNLRSDSAL